MRATPHLQVVPRLGELDLALLYRDHVDFVVRVVRHLGVQAGVLEDVVHDVFLVVHRRRRDYDGRASIRSWLYGIARRVVYHHHRASNRARRREQHASPPSERTSPDRGLAALEALDWVEGFLASLPEEQRMVFVLTELEGMSAPEIAEALGVKLNTVYSRLRLTRHRFSAALANRHREEGVG